jgi:Concanavalin A-like lectin/glucanases superfamily
MSTVLLLHCDGLNGSTTFTDSSGAGHSVTAVGGAQISSAYSQFGNACALFLTNASHLTLDGSADFALGLGDFTIDFWFRLGQTVDLQILFDTSPASIPLRIYYAPNQMRVAIGGVDRITGGTLSGSTNRHFALTRSNGSFRAFLNGVQVGSTYTAAHDLDIAANRPVISSDGTSIGTGGLDAGRIDEFRLIKGFAAWTSNFAVPAGPYSPDLIRQRAPFYHYYRDRPYPIQIRGWTWSHNLNLIIQEQLPTGEQVYDLSPRPYPFPGQTWLERFKLSVYQQLPAGIQGKDFFNLPVPRDYPVQLRTWFGEIPPAVVGAPFAQGDWPNPRSAEFATPLRTWIGLNVPPAVIAAPFNQTDWQLPRAALLPQRSWTWTYNLNLIGQDRLPTGEQVYDAPVGPIQPLRVWQWSYNLNLIGKDALPVGDQQFDLTPFGYIHPTQLRTWIDTVHLALSTPPAPKPFSQIDWPLPRAPLQPALSYTWSYNLNLVGKDQLPTGEQVFELTPRDYSRPHIYLWDWRYNLNLIGQDRLPVGEQRLELTPAGHIHPIQLRTWIDYRSLAIDFVAGAQPDGKRWFDLAPRDDRPYQLRSWTWTYNLNLIGKDQLPVGDQVSDLPPRITPAAIQTWISQVNLALSRPAAPFSQTDWQNPRWPQQAVTNRTWTASYNLNLIGKDRLPTGEAVFDLAPRGHIYPTDLRTFVKQLNLALIVPPAPLPKNQKDWPLPGVPHYPISIRSFINFSNPDFIVSPPPEILPRDPTHARTRGGFELDARGASLDHRGASIDQRGTSPDRRGGGRFSRGRNES